MIDGGNDRGESAVASPAMTALAMDAPRISSTLGAESGQAGMSREHAEWPPVRRHRSACPSSASVSTSRPPATTRHRHTQSTSSAHAPIPSPVYLARSQPIGLLSRSSSVSLRPPSLAGERRSPSNERETSTPIARRRALVRSESLPAFPPEEPGEPFERNRQESVSVDELAALPVNPKSWRPSQLSLYLAATLALPRPLRADITSFVISSCLTGCSFLHLRENDLEELGINVLWRKALLDARDRLKHEANGDRTYWGLQGPPLAEPTPTMARATSLSRRLSDAASVVSEDGEATKEEWKNSWRSRPRTWSTGKVDSLRQTFERAACDDDVSGDRSNDNEATRRARRVLLKQTASHASVATVWSSVDSPSYNIKAEERLSPVLSAAETSLAADEPVDGVSESSSSFSASPDGLSTWTPLPFLTGAGLDFRSATLARDDAAFASSARARHSPDTLRTLSAFDSWMRPNAAIDSFPALPSTNEPEFLDEDELDTIRPVRSPEPHLPASLASPDRPQDPSALAQLFDLDLPRSPPTRPVRDISFGGQSRQAGSEDELVPMLVSTADDQRHERDPSGGEASIRRKKGSLVLVRKSQFVALQSRMGEVEAQLSTVLAASPSPNEPVSADETDGTWQFKGEEIDAEELLQLEAQMRRLEAASSQLDLDDVARSPTGQVPPTANESSSSVRASSVTTAEPSDVAAERPVSLSRRRTRRRQAGSTLSNLAASNDISNYADGTDAASSDAWDVGRSGWPHDRIRGWKQLSGYVVAASIGIGIVAGEVVASKLLGLRRR